MWKANERTADAYPWQKLTWPMARWANKKYIFRIIFYVSLIKNDKQKKEKKLTFLNHLLALDNVFSTKSEEQEVNLVWPNLFLIFDCPPSVYTAHDHDLFRTLSKWISNLCRSDVGCSRFPDVGHLLPLPFVWVLLPYILVQVGNQTPHSRRNLHHLRR